MSEAEFRSHPQKIENLKKEDICSLRKNQKLYNISIFKEDATYMNRI